MTDITPQEIEHLKIHIREDLQMVVNAFNGNLRMWAARNKCSANFRWGYDPKNGEKYLEIYSITMPIVESDPSEEDLKNAESVLSGASTISAK